MPEIDTDKLKLGITLGVISGIALYLTLLALSNIVIGGTYDNFCTDPYIGYPIWLLTIGCINVISVPILTIVLVRYSWYNYRLELPMENGFEFFFYLFLSIFEVVWCAIGADLLRNHVCTTAELSAAVWWMIISTFISCAILLIGPILSTLYWITPSYTHSVNTGSSSTV
jgi:hypothetical protein